MPQTKPRKKVRPKPRAKGKLRQLEKGKVRVIYGKAGRTPSERLLKAPQVYMRTPEPQSPLHKYVQDNLDSGLPILELIHQFQEYDCEHEWEETGWAPTYKAITCRLCGKYERRESK